MTNAIDLDRATGPSDAARLDAPGLQAFAARSVAISQAGGAARRGPFRPEVWLNARQRHASRLAVHWFRIADVALVSAISVAVLWALTPGGLMAAPLSTALPIAVGAIVVLSLMRSLGLYRFARGQKTPLHLAAVTGIALIAGTCAILLDAVLAGGATITAYVIWTALITVSLYALHMGWSDLVSRWRARGALTPNIVLVGATRHAEALIRDALERRDINVLGVFDDRLARSPDSVVGVPVLGDAEALMTHRMTPYVDRIVLAIDPKAEKRVRELTARLSTLPNEVTLLIDPVDAGERSAALDRLARVALASLDGPIDDDRRAFNKRIQDIVIGVVAMIVLAPVMALTALAIRLDSPGPIFFRQRRHGFIHEEIVVWKFRSMRHETADATASRQVTTDDDRVTRVGRFIRSTSLDELPQIFNVLKGEMSLVGPRPHAIGMKTGAVESARLVAEYAHRHRMKPGMTGWAAIKGSRGPLHSAQDVRRRVQLDIEYIERQSVWLDLWVMLVTVPVLLGDPSRDTLMFWRGVWGYLPANIIQGLVGFGAIVVFTRLLSAEDFGRYAIAFSIMTLVHVGTFSWLEAAMARFWAAEEGQSLADHFLTLYRTAAVISLAVLPFAALLLWVSPIGHGLKLAIAAGLVGIPIRCFAKLAQERFRAAGEVTKSAGMDIAVTLGGFAIGAFCAFHGVGAASPLIGLAVGPLLVLPFVLPNELKQARGGALYRDRLGGYARYGYPIAAGLGLSLIMASTDRFLLEIYMGPAAVGAYHAGYSLANRTLDVLFIWLGAAGTPALIMAWERGSREAFMKAAREQASTFILIGLPAAVGVALVARPLADFMIGEDLRSVAASVTPWIALSALLSGSTAYYLSQSFVLGRRTDRLLLTLCIPAASNVILNIILVPLMGVHGAAIATAASFAIGIAASIGMGRSIVRMPIPWDTLVRCGVACVAMTAVVATLPALGGVAELMLKAGVGAAVYGVVALTLNAAGVRDLATRLIGARLSRRAPA